MKKWRRKFQAEYWCLDIKPKKRHRKYIESSNRWDGKKETERQIKESDEYLTINGFYYGSFEG